MMEKVCSIHHTSQRWKTLFGDVDSRALWGESLRPERIYYKGDISALPDRRRPKILITGTRLAGSEQEAVTADVIYHLSCNPSKPIIITALACGVSETALRYALAFDVPVALVMPCSLEEVYPASLAGLADDITSRPGSVMLSQFDKGTAATAINFIIRSKTMAAMASAAVIPFTKEKGSAVMTARLMHDIGKPVYAVPGRITDELSRGCNMLISEGTAAILADYGLLDRIKTHANP